MKAIEIINETANFYKADVNRRALLSKSYCAYNTEDGRHCAVGRCFRKIYKDKGLGLPFNDDSMVDLLSHYGYKSIDVLLMPRYRGHDFELWKDLQLFHDSGENWDDKGLTEQGEETLSNLREKWGDENLENN